MGVSLEVNSFCPHNQSSAPITRTLSALQVDISHPTGALEKVCLRLSMLLHETPGSTETHCCYVPIVVSPLWCFFSLSMKRKPCQTTWAKLHSKSQSGDKNHRRQKFTYHWKYFSMKLQMCGLGSSRLEGFPVTPSLPAYTQHSALPPALTSLFNSYLDKSLTSNGLLSQYPLWKKKKAI